MTPENRKQLADLIDRQRDDIMDEWRRRARPLLSIKDIETPVLNDELPEFLVEVSARLREFDRTHHWGEEAREEESIAEMAKNHGKQRFKIGTDIVEIIMEYGILREVINDCAAKADIDLGGEGSHILLYVFNRAMANAADGFQKEKERELRQRRKDYLAFVMHDLKTPLNAIMIAAQAVESAVDDPKMVTDMVHIILRSGDKLNELLQQTIKIEKTVVREDTEDLYPRNLELWPLVQAVIDEFRIPVSLEHINIHNLIPSGMTVFADAIALSSVFRNLISNAVKYAPGGKIVIGTVTSQKDELEIWVRDSGIGIPRDRLQHLFEKVEPDPEQKGSTGLGLFMVKRLVEAHKGTVAIESKVGDGTTVRIRLPKVAA